jgi:hypothetical protein
MSDQALNKPLSTLAKQLAMLSPGAPEISDSNRDLAHRNGRPGGNSIKNPFRKS